MLFTYRGSPSWILVTVPSPRDGRGRARGGGLTGQASGSRSARSGSSNGVWGGALPIDLANVAALHLVGRDGHTELSARP